MPERVQRYVPSPCSREDCEFPGPSEYRYYRTRLEAKAIEDRHLRSHVRALKPKMDDPKVCTGCGKFQPAEMFRVDPRRDYRRSQCRECENKSRRLGA